MAMQYDRTESAVETNQHVHIPIEY